MKFRRLYKHVHSSNLLLWKRLGRPFIQHYFKRFAVFLPESDKLFDIGCKLVKEVAEIVGNVLSTSILSHSHTNYSVHVDKFSKFLLNMYLYAMIVQWVFFRDMCEKKNRTVQRYFNTFFYMLLPDTSLRYFQRK